MALAIQIKSLISPSIFCSAKISSIKKRLSQKIEATKTSQPHKSNSIDTMLKSKATDLTTLKTAAIFNLDLAFKSGESDLILTCLLNAVGANLVCGQTVRASKYWMEAYQLWYLCIWWINFLLMSMPIIPTICPNMPLPLIETIAENIKYLCLTFLCMHTQFQQEYSIIIMIWSLIRSILKPR